MDNIKSYYMKQYVTVCKFYSCAPCAKLIETRKFVLTIHQI